MLAAVLWYRHCLFLQIISYEKEISTCDYDRYYTIEIEDIDDLSDSELEAIREYKGYISEDLEHLVKVDDDEENEEDEE